MAGASRKAGINFSKNTRPILSSRLFAGASLLSLLVLALALCLNLCLNRCSTTACLTQCFERQTRSRPPLARRSASSASSIPVSRSLCLFPLTGKHESLHVHHGCRGESDEARCGLRNAAADVLTGRRVHTCFVSLSFADERQDGRGRQVVGRPPHGLPGSLSQLRQGSKDRVICILSSTLHSCC